MVCDGIGRYAIDAMQKYKSGFSHSSYHRGMNYRANYHDLILSIGSRV